MTKKNDSRAQIVATIGPSCSSEETILKMVEHSMDVARLNFSWGNIEERIVQIGLIRKAAAKCGRHIPIIQDLPGPRIQKKDSHTYDHHAASALTDNDKQSIVFGVGQELEYIALSFVANERDIEECRKVIVEHGGKQLIIAKIERKIALENLDGIIAAADAIMVARGDLGDDIPLEQVPFAQARIIEATKKAGKPVITATQMMLSMVNSPTPTRAEVTDVANAILQGSDAVMLSEESALGKYPVEVITMMEKIVIEAEKHMSGRLKLNLL